MDHRVNNLLTHDVKKNMKLITGFETEVNRCNYENKKQYNARCCPAIYGNPDNLFNDPGRFIR